MTQTIVDESNRTFLVLRVAAARDESPGADESGTRWCAHVCDPASPLAGLYAFADTLTEARDAVAVLAWTAVLAGELPAVRRLGARPGPHPRRHHEQHRVRRGVAQRRGERRGVKGSR